MKVLLATANDHKLREFRELLEDADIEILSLHDFSHVEMPEETGATMRENAFLKARSGAEQSGLPCLADDSGIEVDALGGAPGVRSARWCTDSDEERTRALLGRLESTAANARSARYRCALCLAFPDGGVLEVEATCEGSIGFELQGKNGFGYDPIFVLTPESGAPSEYIGCTMAEVPSEIKARISHRARAIVRLRENLDHITSAQ
jgi:XTP/dITP diphosphohydrolase